MVGDEEDSPPSRCLQLLAATTDRQADDRSRSLTGARSLTSTHTRYTVPIAGLILSITGRSEGTSDVDPTGVVGAAGAGADVWRAVAQRVRVADRRHLAAERRAGLHDPGPCLLYTSDAADDLLCVDLGGRRIIKKKK